MRKKHVTLDDIAKATNLSMYAVSRAVAGKPGISASTRKRILQVSEELGYTRPATKKSGQYLLLCIPQSDVEDATFWMPVLQGIESAASRKGFALRVKVIKPFDEARIDSEVRGATGIFYAGHKSIGTAYKYMGPACPSLLMTYPPESLFRMDAIHTGDREAASALCSKLIEWGHRKIGFFGTTERPSTRSRIEGVNEAMHAAGLKLDHVWNSPDHADVDWVRAELARLQDIDRLPTAVMCSTEQLAQSLIFVLGSMQIAVPKDISVTAFNIDQDDRSPIPLTGTAFDKFDYGRLAFEYLLDRIERPGSAFNRIVVLPSLLIRETAGPAKSTS